MVGGRISPADTHMLWLLTPGGGHLRPAPHRHITSSCAPPSSRRPPQPRPGAAQGVWVLGEERGESSSPQLHHTPLPSSSQENVYISSMKQDVTRIHTIKSIRLDSWSNYTDNIFPVKNTVINSHYD